MTKNLPLLLLLVTCFAQAQKTTASRELIGAAADHAVPGAVHLWYKNANTIPAYIAFGDNVTHDEEGFFYWLKKQFNLPANYTTKLIGEEQDEIGWMHHRYQLCVQGVPVRDGIFLLHTRQGRVLKFNGSVFTAIHVNTTPTLTEQAALQLALRYVGASKYKWELEAEEHKHVQHEHDEGHFFLPQGSLEIVQRLSERGSLQFHLAWKFDIYAHQPLSRQYVYVDAHTGEVLRSYNRIHTANANGIAVTAYRGAQAIVSDSYAGGFRLRETTRGNGINTYNMLTGTNYSNAIDFSDADNYWNNVNAAKDQYAGDAHWGAEMSYDFYKNNFNRNSINNAGFALNSYVHYQVNYDNAFWDGMRMTYGDGAGNIKPLVSLDIAGHEITHGLTEFTANLDYQYESGALNESFSDIFGVAIEHFATPAQSNWTMGEDIGIIIRSISNPKAYNDPNCYNGQYWYTGTADNGGVHTNSGVQNFWYYILVNGRTGTNDLGNAYNVTGLGRAKANAIAYRNLTVYLTNTSDYADARFYAIQSAIDLYGNCSPEVTSTANAWYAVGVGTHYSPVVTAQFAQSPTVACKAPFSVSFINQSNNALSYKWYFGDGDSSTAINPSHTYLNTGIYTVRLYVSGGSCGSDSLVKTNLVNISAANPCVAIMPATGVGQTQTSCNGTLYDNGGPNNVYTNNVNSTITISPSGASRVTLNFVKFSTEANYDYLYVYDGATTTGTLLGAYSGTTIPATISSTLPSVTVKFVSDQAVVDSGFAIRWSCTPIASPPVANFSVSTPTSCNGKIQFTDLSTGGVSSWLWNFGDGTTSTLQNPLKSYITNGTYTVSLTAYNSFGNHTKTMANAVTVNKPAAPALVHGSRCGPGTVQLSAITGNKVNWYDSLHALNSISSANPFTSPPISATKNYYAEMVVPQTKYKVGPVDSSLGGGSYFNGNAARANRFRVMKPCTLLSAYVYASVAGYRTVQYRDTFGVVLFSRNVYVPVGGSRIQLNIPLIASPTAVYELGVQDSMKMYRNVRGASYPYNDAGGLVSIIGNNIPSGSTSNPQQYYYYFYDWEVQAPDCISLRAAATATVNHALTYTVSKTNATCNGASTGSASIINQGGAYTYAWSNGDTTSSITNLASGTYYVTISNGAFCSSIDSVVIDQPAAVAGTITTTSVSCFGGNNGSATVTGTGGNGGYTYMWNNGSNSATINNLATGNYAVTITDANSCSVVKTATILEPAAPLNASTIPTAVSCHGGNNGAATVSVTGGTPGYTYTWSNGDTTANIRNLSAYTYTVTVRDANLCSVIKHVTVAEPSSVSATITTTPVACYGESTGAALVTVSGGTPGYTYRWNTGAVSAQISNLTQGMYSVTVRDANQCSITQQVQITAPNVLAASLSSTITNCGGANGTATVSPTGGNGGYSYIWSNGQTLATASNLSFGVYQVTISDSKNCTTTASVSVHEPAGFSVSHSTTMVNCFGQNSGTASLTTSHGTAGFTFNWSNGLSGAQQYSLHANTYYITVTDTMNCSQMDTVVITQPNALVVTTSAVDVACYGAKSGAVTASSTGGNGGYQYLWSNGGTQSSIQNLAAGNYNVVVTDAKGCTTTAFAIVSQANALISSMGATSVLCHGEKDGRVNVSAAGGTAPYRFYWNTGDSTAAVNGLAAAIYSITITDANGCTTTNQAIIQQPAPLNATISSTPEVSGYSNGTVAISPVGGTPPYSCDWGNFIGCNRFALTADTYPVILRDSNGCTRQLQVTVGEVSGIDAANEFNFLDVFPNPANDKLVVKWELNSVTAPMELTLCNFLGQVVLRENIGADRIGTVTFNVDHVAASAYQMVLSCGMARLVKNLVIVR